MSIKLMTSTQIRDDLYTLALTWPDGLPSEQVDRANALRAELKRRGEDPAVTKAEAPVSRAARRVEEMTTPALEQGLRELSTTMTKDDDAAQDRFAGIRFELRKRALKEKAEPEKAKVEPEQVKVAPARPPIALEMPDDEEVKRYQDEIKKVKRVPEGAKVEYERKPVDEPKAAPPLKVAGFTATAMRDDNDNVILLRYQRDTPNSTITMIRSMSIHEMANFVRMCEAALDEARRRKDLDDE